MSEFSRFEIYMLLNQNKPLWLSYIDLSDVDLRGVDLRGATLFHANLRGVDLRGAIFNRNIHGWLRFIRSKYGWSGFA